METHLGPCSWNCVNATKTCRRRRAQVAGEQKFLFCFPPQNNQFTIETFCFRSGHAPKWKNVQKRGRTPLHEAF